MVELQKKLVKIGSSYGIIVPKTLVECKVLNPEKKMLINIEELPLSFSLVRASLKKECAIC